MTSVIRAMLKQLTALPYAEYPFVSLYLDMVPDGTGRRQSLQVLERWLDEQAKQFTDEPSARESFATDQQRILDYINTEAPTDARGLVIYACSGAGVWGALPLQMQIETNMAVDHYPYVFDLVRLDDDYETTVLVLATGQETEMLLISLTDIDVVAESEAPEKIKRFDAGGQAQMLFQRRTENLVKAHMKDVGKELARLIRRYGVSRIVFAGNDAIKSAVRDELPDTVKDEMIEYVNLDPQSNINDLRETVLQLQQEAERAQETEDVALLEDRVATKGGLGVAGLADTAMALSKGQVHQLIALRSFDAQGGECKNCGMVQAGEPSRCPYCGGEMLRVNLREVFAARAIQQDAAIQTVESSTFLEQHEGVGALLRYRDDVPEGA